MHASVQFSPFSGKVCESPATTGGTLDKTGNILVGETYTFSCSEGILTCQSFFLLL